MNKPNPCSLAFVLLSWCLSKTLLAEDLPNNICAGTYALLNLIDRPTWGDSVCVVPYHSVLMENGFQYQTLDSQGVQKIYSQTELRIGLPHHNEIAVLLPNRINQSYLPPGATATTLGLKHMLSANQAWITSIEDMVTLPSGSDAFGMRGFGNTFNGIFSHNLTSTIGLTGMLGISTMTQSMVNGGKRYTSFNPDLTISWSKNNIQCYVEIYGQSKTGPYQHSGFNMDTGVIYLLTPNIEIDAEFGHRIDGRLGGFENYVGAGISFFSGI